MDKRMQLDAQQREVCKRYDAVFQSSLLSQKLGISRAFDPATLPLHGLRRLPQAGTSRWYIWTGEFSLYPDFFVPLCGEHLRDRCPAVLPFLGLAPGWRFLLPPGHEDVWLDSTLIETWSRMAR